MLEILTFMIIWIHLFDSELKDIVLRNSEFENRIQAK